MSSKRIGIWLTPSEKAHVEALIADHHSDMWSRSCELREIAEILRGEGDKQLAKGYDLIADDYSAKTDEARELLEEFRYPLKPDHTVPKGDTK